MILDCDDDLEIFGGGGGGLGAFCGRTSGALIGRTGLVSAFDGGAPPCGDDGRAVVVGVCVAPANVGGCSGRSCVFRPRACCCCGSLSRLVICG